MPMFYSFSTRIYESVIWIKYWWMSERVWGRGVGVEDNLGGPVWVMEWTSVIVIMLRIPKKKKKRKKKLPNKIKEQRGRAAQQKIKVQSKLFHCINLSAIKTNENDSPFRLLSSWSFPVKSWSPCIIACTLFIGNWTWNLSDVNLLIEQLVKCLKRNRICGRELHPLTIPYITHQFLLFLGTPWAPSL